jgi:hypothetical protein
MSRSSAVRRLGATRARRAGGGPLGDQPLRRASVEARHVELVDRDAAAGTHHPRQVLERLGQGLDVAGPWCWSRPMPANAKAPARSEWRLMTATHNLIKLYKHSTAPLAV